MIIRCRTVDVNVSNAFTLVEVLVAFTLMVAVLAGVFFSYVQANRLSEWSSMSLAAQNYAAQGIERARAAQWNSQQYPYTNGPGTGDELPATNYNGGPVFKETNTLDIPQTGAPFYVTNYIYETTNQSYPPPTIREIRSVVTWTFPLTGRVFTNCVVTLRAPDE